MEYHVLPVIVVTGVSYASSIYFQDKDKLRHQCKGESYKRKKEKYPNDQVYMSASWQRKRVFGWGVEGINWFIEGQAFLRSFYLAPLTPTPSPFPVGKLDQRHTGRLRRRDNWLMRYGGGGGRIIRLQESMVLYKTYNTLWEQRVKEDLRMWNSGGYNGDFME